MQLVRSRPPASTTLCGFRTDLLPQGRGQGSSLRRGRYGEATGAHSIPVSGVSAYHAHHGNDDDLSRRRDPRICTVYAARAAARPFGARGGLWALCTGALCTGPSAPNSHRMRSWFLVKPYSTRDPHALKLAGTSEHHVRINCTVQRSTAASSASLIDEEIRGALARASHNHHALRHAAPTHGVPPVTLRHSWRSLRERCGLLRAAMLPSC